MRAGLARLHDGGRSTAAGIYRDYHRNGCPDIERTRDLKPGCLVLYRRPGKRIHHVAIHATRVPDTALDAGSVKVGPVALEPGGGGSRTTSPRAAPRRSAGVRLTASDYQGTGVGWVAKDPFPLLEEPTIA